MSCEQYEYNRIEAQQCETSNQKNHNMTLRWWWCFLQFFSWSSQRLCSPFCHRGLKIHNYVHAYNYRLLPGPPQGIIVMPPLVFCHCTDCCQIYFRLSVYLVFNAYNLKHLRQSSAVESSNQLVAITCFPLVGAVSQLVWGSLVRYLLSCLSQMFT